MQIQKIIPKQPAVQLEHHKLLEMSIDMNEPMDGLETTFIEPIVCCKYLESLFSDAFAVETLMSLCAWKLNKLLLTLARLFMNRFSLSSHEPFPQAKYLQLCTLQQIPTHPQQI